MSVDKPRLAEAHLDTRGTRVTTILVAFLAPLAIACSSHSDPYLGVECTGLCQGFGLFCHRSTCQPLDEFQCQSTADCSGGDVCTAFMGGTCGECLVGDANPCGDAMYCRASDKSCVDSPDLDAPCDPAIRFHCGDRGYCACDAAGPTPDCTREAATCWAPRAAGATCRTDEACAQPLTCAFGQCRAPGTRLGACREDGTCDAGLECFDNTTCYDPFPIGLWELSLRTSSFTFDPAPKFTFMVTGNDQSSPASSPVEFRVGAAQQCFQGASAQVLLLMPAEMTTLTISGETAIIRLPSVTDIDRSSSDPNTSIQVFAPTELRATILNGSASGTVEIQPKLWCSYGPQSTETRLVDYAVDVDLTLTRQLVP